MSRLVAIGRLTKISERFIGPPRPRPVMSRPPRPRPPCPLAPPPVSVVGRRTRLEPQLPFGDDGLARAQPFVDPMSLIDALSGRDRPLLDGGILLDHEHVLPVLARLHRLRGHDDGLRQGGDAQRDARELAGPQPAVGLSNVALSLIVSVVMSTALSTKVSSPVAACESGVLRGRDDRQFAFRHVTLDRRQMHGGHRKRDILSAAPARWSSARSSSPSRGCRL